jgi:succinyl-diaminopimelate desuccinylase
LVIVPDEETGGEYGTQYLFERGYIKKENSIGMLMPEPTSGAIWHACRGACSLSVRVRGKPVHVVLQSRGINAFEGMLTVANALRKIKEKVERRRTGYAVAAGEPNNSILMLGGICRCGVNFNIVPGECTFSIERRINPEENLDQEKQRLFDLFERLHGQGIDVQATVLQEGESAGISPDHYLARVLTQSVRATYGRRPNFYMCPGLLEIRYYLKHGIPAYAFGPGDLSCAHGPNEFINIERMYKCTEVYALTALKLLSIGSAV